MNDNTPGDQYREFMNQDDTDINIKPLNGLAESAGSAGWVCNVCQTKTIHISPLGKRGVIICEECADAPSPHHIVIEAQNGSSSATITKTSP